MHKSPHKQKINKKFTGKGTNKINKLFFSQKLSIFGSLLFSLFPLHVYACTQISTISLHIFLAILFYYYFFQIAMKGNLKSILIFLDVQSPSKIILWFCTLVSKCKINTSKTEITKMAIPKKKNSSPDFSWFSFQ